MDIIDDEPDELICSNCRINLDSENAIYKTAPDEFKHGFEFDQDLEDFDDYNSVFCTQCYHNLEEVNVMKSDKQPVIDPDAYPKG